MCSLQRGKMQAVGTLMSGTIKSWPTAVVTSGSSKRGAGEEHVGRACGEWGWRLLLGSVHHSMCRAGGGGAWQRCTSMRKNERAGGPHCKQCGVTNNQFDGAAALLMRQGQCEWGRVGR